MVDVVSKAGAVDEEGGGLDGSGREGFGSRIGPQMIVQARDSHGDKSEGGLKPCKIRRAVVQWRVVGGGWWWW